MKLGKYEINLHLYNEWECLNILWDEDAHWNWYDMTLIALYGDYIKYDTEDNMSNIVCLDEKIKSIFDDARKAKEKIDYSIEIVFGIIGLVWTLNVEKMK